MHRFTNKILWVVLCLFLLSCLTPGCFARQERAKQRNPLQDPKVDWVTSAARGGGLERHIFYSSAAGTEVSYHVYLPNEYQGASGRRFPVLYWLHGRSGGIRAIPHLAKHFDRSMRAGDLPPVIVVFPNGRDRKMWVDSKDGRVPMETVVVKELIPHIDATFRTVATRDGRLLEGFSMGGYGSGRLGFKYPEVFGAVSMLGAGPLQLELKASIGPPAMGAARDKLLQDVYGGDQRFFRDQSPWVLAERNAAALRGRTKIRILIGDRDAALQFNRDLSAHLTRLDIPHSFRAVPGVGHQPKRLLDAIRGDSRLFYRSLFDRYAFTGSSGPGDLTIPGKRPGSALVARSVRLAPSLATP